MLIRMYSSSENVNFKSFLSLLLFFKAKVILKRFDQVIKILTEVKFKYILHWFHALLDESVIPMKVLENKMLIIKRHWKNIYLLDSLELI